MKISKNETKKFADYQVYEIKSQPLPRSFRDWLMRREPIHEDYEVPIRLVVEADDTTGLVIYQLTDKKNRPIFTNGQDDIILDNPCRLLLLLPNIRQAFHLSGFRPKLVTEYKDRIGIRYNGPNETVVVNMETSLSESPEVKS